MSFCDVLLVSLVPLSHSCPYCHHDLVCLSPCCVLPTRANTVGPHSAPVCMCPHTCYMHGASCAWCKLEECQRSSFRVYLTSWSKLGAIVAACVGTSVYISSTMHALLLQHTGGARHHSTDVMVNDGWQSLSKFSNCNLKAPCIKATAHLLWQTKLHLLSCTVSMHGIEDHWECGLSELQLQRQQ